MKTTGAILKKAREEKGLSLNEIALSLKISSKVLKAIEEGDEKNLPAKTFLRGFVQSYAAYMRLDVDSVMNSFYEEVGSTRPKPLIRETPAELAQSKTQSKANKAAEKEKTHLSAFNDTPASNVVPLKAEKTKKIDTNENASANTEAAPASASKVKETDHLAPINQQNNSKTIIFAVIAVILIGLILFTKKMIDKYSREAQVGSNTTVTEPIEQTGPVPPSDPANPPAPTISDVKTDVAAPVVADPNKIVAKPSEKPLSSTPPVVSAPVQTPVTTANTQQSQASNPTTQTTPAATSTATATATATTTNTAAADANKTVPAKPEEKVNKTVELIIEALDNVQIEYSSNTGKKSNLQLSAEQVHTFKSKNGLKLNISNGGAVNLILNGRDLGIPGDLGKPIKLSY